LEDIFSNGKSLLFGHLIRFAVTSLECPQDNHS